MGGAHRLWQPYRPTGTGRDQVPTAIEGEDPDCRVGGQTREQPSRGTGAPLGEGTSVPGARHPLVAAEERGHRPAPADSGRQRPIDVFLDRPDPPCVVGAEASKAARDLPRTARTLGAPSEVPRVMVVASLGDVEAAKRAGMPAIVVPSAGPGEDEQRKAGAVATRDTPDGLAAAPYDTPLA
ncbi:HAD family hydrolase [Streptomyces sp. NPDC005476]|uniref:HAD family hydrolase n=1 Tax=Streptomyces sp. NPDC005476 TaxID=3156882 RepID=UPI003454FC7A